MWDNKAAKRLEEGLSPPRSLPRLQYSIDTYVNSSKKKFCTMAVV